MSDVSNIKAALYESLGPKIAPDTLNHNKQAIKTLGFDWDMGGWNNIRMGVEIMICIAKKYNRALVLPKPGKWYLLKGDTHLFDFYDEASFTSFVPVSPEAKQGKTWIVPPKFKTKKGGTIDIGKFKPYQDYDHWFFPKETRMFAYFPLALPDPRSLYSLIQSALRIKSSLIEKASKVLEKNDLELGRYIALHVRRNDFQYTDIRERKPGDIVTYVTQGIHPGVPILILSDVYDAELIRFFEKEGHRVVCWSEKRGSPEKSFQELKQAKEKTGRRSPTVFKVLETHSMETDDKESVVIDMLCAATASKFYGSSLSTFSSCIMHWRGLLSTHYPQIDPQVMYTMPGHKGQPWWSNVQTGYWDEKKRNQIKTRLVLKMKRLDDHRVFKKALRLSKQMKRRSKTYARLLEWLKS